MASSQQDSWENNIYVLTTTRITVVFGLTYLVKSCYQLYTMMRAPDDSTAIANRAIESEEENIGLELDLSSFVFESAAAFGQGNIIDVAEMVEVRRPLPAYCPDARRPGLNIPIVDNSAPPNHIR